MRCLLFSLLILFSFSCNKKDESVEPDEEEALYVYVNSGKGVYCLSPHDGSVLWTYDDVDFTQDIPAPVINGDVVYVSGTQGVYALQALTGKIIWSSLQVSLPITAPTVVGETLYIGSLKGIYALNTSTGDTKWLYNSGIVAASPIVLESNLYFTDQLGVLRCLDKDSGNLIWETDNLSVSFRSGLQPFKKSLLTGLWSKFASINIETRSLNWEFRAAGEVFSSPIVYEDKAIFASEYGYALYALNAESGKEEWRLSNDSQVFSSPYVKRDTLFFGFLSGDFYSLNPDNGAVYWKTNINSSIMYSSPVASSGKVFFPANKSFICLSSKNGSLLWKITADDDSGFSDATVLLKNGKVLHPSSSGYN